MPGICVGNLEDVQTGDISFGPHEPVEVMSEVVKHEKPVELYLQCKGSQLHQEMNWPYYKKVHICRHCDSLYDPDA